MAAEERWPVFVDTNVLVAGLLSRTGASAAILDLGEAEELTIVVSQQVLVEADRTILIKFPHLIEHYRTFMKNLAPLLANDPSTHAVHEAKRIIHPNDAPILAAARQETLDYLVTLNTRHFATPKVRAFLSIPIVPPAEFLLAFRNFWEHPK